MMKRISFTFAATLLLAALLNQPFASAQGGANNVDASIDAILNAPPPAPAAPAAAPVSTAGRAVATAKAAAAAVEAITDEGEAAMATPEPAKEAAVEVAEATAVEAPDVEVVEATAVEAPAVEVAEAPAAPAAAEVRPAAPAAEVAEAKTTVDGDEVRVTMAFDEAPLPDVIRAFRDASGATIISRWTNATPQLVSMRFEDKPWKQGLMAILAPYGLQLTEEPRGSGVYVVGEKSTVIPRYTQTFELKHLKAADVEKLLKSVLGDASSLTVAFPSANAVVVKATDEQLRECEKMLEVLDKPSRQVYIEARFVRLNSSASKQLGMKWDSLSEWGVTLEKMSAGYEANKGTTARYNTGTTEVKETAEILGVVDGINYTKGTYDKESGITTYEPTYRKKDGLVYRIPGDIAAAPNAGRTAESMGWKRASGFGGQLSVDQLRLAISAFEQMDGVQMFSNPKIIVENEKTAKIDMTTKEPNVEIDYQAATQAGQRDSISSKLVTIPGKKESWVGEAFFSYGITLDVTPRVSPTGLITVDIVPAISSLDDSRVIPLGEGAANYYPIIKMQRLETRFTMGDGKTAVIGGLTQTSEGNIDSGIPLLRSIPWVGPRLFGWKSRQKIQDEIIIFVTVGIVDGETIEQSGGMPKNAVLGRGLLDGTIKEPGDRTDEEMFNLDTKPKGFRIK